MMEKIKSRWRKNFDESNNIIQPNDIDASDDQNHHEEDEQNNHHHNNNNHNNHHHHHNNNNNNSHNNNHHHHHSKPPTYETLTENLYLDKRKNEHSRSRKDARSIVCDCILTKEERSRGVKGCLDDCLNRMLMIECGSKCSLGEHCLNKRFQKCQSAKVEMFKTRKKGWGLRTTTDLPANSFIMEYVGEVVRSKEFRKRVKKYTKQKIKHHYFMALKSDEIIDATCKGNLTRFINHSCEPNCETQKWTVNGDLRIGFFTLRHLQAGEEVTFDYQFQRYGKKAQKCFCEAPSCRGYIGGNEQSFSLNGKETNEKSFKKRLMVDVSTEDKINALSEAASENGLKTRDQVIALASLSIKAEEVGDRRKLLDIIKATKSEISLRLFIDYHGLEILYLWMRDPQADCDFKTTIIEILEKLPITNKTKVLESNVYKMIERWATEDPSSTTTNSKTKALANILLKKFQALSPGFKIPRLNRLQRMEMEKKMDQEVIGCDQNNQEQKSLPFKPNLPYFKSITTIATTTTTTTSTLKNNILPSKRKPDSNNIDLTPAPKISKEEHRQQFEMHVRLKDYYDTIERHYGSAALEQIKLTQTYGRKPEPTNLPKLIVLANNSIESALTIDDEIAFSICDYDEYYTIRDKPISVNDTIDHLYPYPGSYYTTPTGETWFATVTLDRRTHQPRTVVSQSAPKKSDSLQVSRKNPWQTHRLK